MRFHETLHGVYFDDLDAFHMLHNARYVLLFERTIGAFWDELKARGKLDPDSPDHHQFVRANHIEYVRPVLGTGALRVRVWVEKLGNSSLTFGLRALARDEDVDHAFGSRTMVKVDPKTLRPAPWTDEMRAALAEYRKDSDG